MMKDTFYIWLGIVISLLPFVGIPESWRVTLIVVCGLTLTLLSLAPLILDQVKEKPKVKKKQSKSTTTHTLIVSTPVDTPASSGGANTVA